MKPSLCITAIEFILVPTATALTGQISLLMIQEFILVLLAEINRPIFNIDDSGVVGLLSVALILLFSIKHYVS